MIKKIDKLIIEKTLQEARKSPRRRAIYCFHNSEDTLQRMINAGLSNTYARPHKHENPDKLEIFVILKGKVAIILFDDTGKIIYNIILEDKGQNKAFEIPPKVWHSFIILSNEAVLYEVIEGKYDPKTHKNFAEWAPAEENIEESKKYLEEMKNYINKI